MKLKFKHQPFQEDAARAVCAVFEGQQILAGQAKYLMDVGGDTKNAEQVDEYDHHHWNRPLIVSPEITAQNELLFWYNNVTI